MTPEAALDLAISQQEVLMHQYQKAINAGYAQIGEIGLQVDENERQQAVVGGQLEALRLAKEQLKGRNVAFAEWIKEHDDASN